MAQPLNRQRPAGASAFGRDVPFRPLAFPESLRIPLPHNTNTANLKPRGSVVRTGEALVIDPSTMSPTPIAPMAGTIGDITEVMLFNGQSFRAVELIVDPQASDETAAMLLPAPDMMTDPEKAARHLAGRGVAADRVASPNLFAQLRQCLEKKPDTLICCAIDSDPDTPLNASVAAMFHEDMIAGLTALADVTGASRRLLVMDNAPPQANAKIETIPLASGYPLTDPTILLYATLRRRLKPGELPVKEGVILIDAPCAASIGAAARRGETMRQVPLVLRDHRAQHTHHLLAPVGMSLDDILRQLRLSSDRALPRGGDALRDRRIHTDAVVSAGELIVHLSMEESPEIPDPCIRCGWCVESCPTHIHPAGLLQAAQNDDPVLALHYGLPACIECGICGYVCPSRLPLLGGIRVLRGSNP